MNTQQNCWWTLSLYQQWSRASCDTRDTTLQAVLAGSTCLPHGVIQVCKTNFVSANCTHSNPLFQMTLAHHYPPPYQVWLQKISSGQSGTDGHGNSRIYIYQIQIRLRTSGKLAVAWTEQRMKVCCPLSPLCIADRSFSCRDKMRACRRRANRRRENDKITDCPFRKRNHTATERGMTLTTQDLSFSGSGSTSSSALEASGSAGSCLHARSLISILKTTCSKSGLNGQGRALLTFHPLDTSSEIFITVSASV